MNSQYNLLPYNALQYNVTAAIEVTISHVVSGNDATVVKNVATPKVDGIVAVDILAKSITDKRLTENVKMSAWFTPKNAPQSDPWS